MKIKKLKLAEIVDSEGGLIGNDSIPKSGGDLESASTKMTDYNQGVGTQPFRYDMLARFGFGLLPFYEGKGADEQRNLLDSLNQILLDNNISLLKYYYKTPNKLKNDYRLIMKGSAVNLGGSDKDNDQLIQKIVKLFEGYIKNVFNEPNTIDEEKVIEDKVLDEKNVFDFPQKTKNKELKIDKIEKIAGLINKLGVKDKNKIINLLEINNE